MVLAGVFLFLLCSAALRGLVFAETFWQQSSACIFPLEGAVTSEMHQQPGLETALEAPGKDFHTSL